MTNSTALLAGLALTLATGCYDSPCPEGRFPDLTVDGPVMYVDAEYGADGATGICTDPISEIWLAVLRLDGPGSVIAAPGTYTGNVVADADLAIYGYGEGDVFVEGETVGVSVSDAASLHLQDLTSRSAEFGLWTSGVARITAERVSLSGNSRFGAFVDGGEVELLDVRLVDNGPGDPGQTSGGMQLTGGAQGTITDAEVTGNAGVGLWVLGSTLEVLGATIEDTGLDADGTSGRGVEVGPGSEDGIRPELYLDDVHITAFSEVGVVAREATVSLTSVDIAEPTACDLGFAGTGLAVTDTSTELLDVDLSGLCTTGIWGDRGALVAEDVRIADIAPGADGLGTALRLADMAATLNDSRLEDLTGAAVYGRCLSDLQLVETYIAGVTAGTGGLGGDGLLVGDTTVSLTGGTIEDVERCGISLNGYSDLDAVGVTFSAGVGDACLCDIDPDPDWEDAFVADNEPTPGGTPVVDADAGGECPEPYPGSCPVEE